MKIEFSVSARLKKESEPIKDFIEKNHRWCSDKIGSVFGFVEWMPLYGGRIFSKPELSSDDLAWMYDQGVGFKIPISNSQVSLQDYNISKPILKKHHRLGNSVIVVCDSLVPLLRTDFPNYEIQASSIKNILPDDVYDYLKVYDSIVLPPILNSNVALLKSMREKSKLELFVNSSCQVGCLDRVCYEVFSGINSGKIHNLGYGKICPHKDKENLRSNRVHYNVNEFVELGYSRFKTLANNQ